MNLFEEQVKGVKFFLKVCAPLIFTIFTLMYIKVQNDIARNSPLFLKLKDSLELELNFYFKRNTDFYSKVFELIENLKLEIGKTTNFYRFLDTKIECRQKEFNDFILSKKKELIELIDNQKQYKFNLNQNANLDKWWLGKKNYDLFEIKGKNFFEKITKIAFKYNESMDFHYDCSGVIIGEKDMSRIYKECYFLGFKKEKVNLLTMERFIRMEKHKVDSNFTACNEALNDFLNDLAKEKGLSS